MGIFKTNKPSENALDRARAFGRNAKRGEYFGKLPLVGNYCSRKAQANRLAAGQFLDDSEFAEVGKRMSDWEIVKIFGKVLTEMAADASERRVKGAVSESDRRVKALEILRAQVKRTREIIDAAIVQRDQAYKNMIKQLEDIKKSGLGPEKKEREMTKIREEYEIIRLAFSKMERDFAEIKKVVDDEENGAREP